MCLQKERCFVIAVHFGDIELVTKTDKRMAEVKRGFAEGFEVKDIGEPHHYLGGTVIQNPQPGDVWMPEESCRNLEWRMPSQSTHQ